MNRILSHTMPASVLPSAMEAKLRQISRRQVAIAVVRAVAIAVATLIVALVVAMLIDWQLTLFDTGVRMALTATALLSSVVALLVAGVSPLRAALRWSRAATSADREIPQLEERWQTVVSLAASGLRPPSPTAQAMLRQVTSEAVAIGRIVQPGRVAHPATLRPAGIWLAGCVLVLVAFLAMDWPQTSVLLRRFWSPTADITATQLRSATGDVVVPRGESVNLIADLSGLPRRSATLLIARPDTTEEAIELRPDAERAAFVHRLPVDDSFRYRIRAGDGQTAWHTITAVDFPALAEVRFTVVAPAYLNRPDYEKTVIPSRVKVVQGSRLELAMRPKETLERLELTLVSGAESGTTARQVVSLATDAYGWYRFTTPLLTDLALSPQLWNAHGLTNEDRPLCRIQVIADNAPVARVLSPTDEMAVAADDVIDINFEAHDDHGIATAELVVYDETPTEDGQPPRILRVLPIPLGDQRLEKHVLATTQLDLQQLGLKPGTQISYAVRVTDNRMVPVEPETETLLVESTATETPRDGSEADRSDSLGDPKAAANNSREAPNAPPGSEPKTAPSQLADAVDRSNIALPKKPESSVAANDERRPAEPSASKAPSDSGKTNDERNPATNPDDATLADKLASQRSDSETASNAVAQNKASPAEEQTDAADPSEQSPARPRGGQPANQNDLTEEPGETPPPTRALAMAPQSAESGQNAETNRRRLKITERLTAVAATAAAGQRAETADIRERVVAIDALLADVETGLTRVLNRDIPDDDRSAQFRILDVQLGEVETTISDLRNETRDHQFAFVGLQMLDIGRSHVTPARERVFVAIREPVTGADSHTQVALQHVVRARELLAALLKRYDRAARDRQLADALDEAAKMYEVYVEKSQQLLREARQNRNPLERKMAIIEVDQEYLDRYAEVLTLRREMMAEFGHILSDDPRLLARYLDLIKRRRASLRDQLSELAEQQQEVATELSGWLAAGDPQREDLWALLVELRMQASTPLAKESAELAERIEKQLPLVLETAQGTPARVVELGRQIAQTSRAISLEARRQIQQPAAALDLRPKAGQLVKLFGELDAALEQLNFEHAKETEVAAYVTSRLLESRTVADQADAWMQIAGHVHSRRYHGMAEVDQHRLAIATELLRVDMQGMEAELEGQFQRLAERSVPAEIASQIRELQRLMEEITFHQASATFAMTQDRLPVAEVLQALVTTGFEHAEKLLDRIRRETAAALDEFDVPNPSVDDLEDPTLDAFLARLEREPNIEAQLGLPDRPRNLRVIAESLVWQETGGDLLGDSEQAARMRAKQAMRPPKPGSKPPEKPENELTEEERQQRAEARELEENLARTLAALKERANDPSTSAEERRKLEQRTEDLQRMLDQLGEGGVPDDLWNRIAESEQTHAMLKALARGEGVPDEQWNKLVSTLDDGLWQVGGRTPPEAYRKAIEQYQERIRRLTSDDEDDAR
ncbi:MAG TPA: hypothetical protein VM165_18830 [Planctomycetaceae bacterium]|nr:hypothetical protein [Planctomycetaceae bacterium]